MSNPTLILNFENGKMRGVSDLEQAGRAEAVMSLGFTNFSGPDEINGFTYHNKGDTPPTEAEIQTEIARLQAEYDAQEYARNRASAYDSVGDQLDQLMKDMRDGTTTHQTACEAVKAKYPKPE